MGQESARIKKPPAVIPPVPQQVIEETHSFTVTDGTITYKLLNTLGSGAFGTVHKAVDLNAPNNDRWRAVKIMSPSASQLKYVQAELTTLKQLTHPAIVRYRNSFVKTKSTGEQTFYLVMELCEGDSLEKYLKENKTLPIDVVMLWFIKLVEALKYFHDLGLIHRDIKPDNIFTTLHEEVKLGDFGVAKSTTDPGTYAATTKVGTNGYWAPEVEENLGYNTKADIWSLGCVLYQCVYGSLNRADYDKQCSGIKAESVRMLLQKMLCRDVRNRYSAEQLLYDPILIGWRLILGMDMPSEFRTSVPQCDCLLPLLDMIQYGTIHARFVGMSFFSSSKLTSNSNIRKLLITSNALEIYAQDLLSQDGDKLVGQQSQEILTPFNDFSGSELREASCISRVIQLADRHKKLCLPALNILLKLAKEDVATKAIIAHNPQAQDLVKDFIIGHPQYSPLISPENFSSFTSYLQPNQIALIVAEFFKSKPRLSSPTRRDLLLTAINYGHFEVVFEYLFDWPLIANVASATGECLSKYSRNLPLSFESYMCATCKIDKPGDILCAACRRLHHTHELTLTTKTDVFCSGRTPTLTTPNFPISKNFDRHTEATFSSATPSIICRAGNIEARLQPTDTCVCTSSIAYVDKKYCFYFEAEIKVAGSTNSGISIGFAPHHIKSLPGKEDGSIGYCSNGKLLICNEEVPFGPRYSAGDIIGCGILLNGQVFFTKNGVFVNYHQFNSSKRNVVLFHAIGLHAGRFNLRVNYGATPFAYNYSPDIKLQQNNLPLRLEVCKEILQVTSLEAIVQQLSHVKDRNSILYYLVCLHSVAIQDPGNRQKIASMIQRQVLWRALETKQADTQWASSLVNEIFNGPSRSTTLQENQTPTPQPTPAPSQPASGPKQPYRSPSVPSAQPQAGGPKKQFVPNPNPSPGVRATEIPSKPKMQNYSTTSIPDFKPKPVTVIGQPGLQSSSVTPSPTPTPVSASTSPSQTTIVPNPGLELTFVLERHGTADKFELYLTTPILFQTLLEAVCTELNVTKDAVSAIRKKSNDTIVQSDQHSKRLQGGETLVAFLK